MATRCALHPLNFFIEASSSHMVIVQKVSFLSINSRPFMSPGDCFNALTEASFALKKGIKYKIDLTRRRVTEINANENVLMNVTKKKQNYLFAKHMQWMDWLKLVYV